jgi:hypothetical protein
MLYQPCDTIVTTNRKEYTVAFIEAITGQLLNQKKSITPIVIELLVQNTTLNLKNIYNLIYQWAKNSRNPNPSIYKYTYFWKYYITPIEDIIQVKFAEIAQEIKSIEYSMGKYEMNFQVEENIRNIFLEIITLIDDQADLVGRPVVHKVPKISYKIPVEV